MNSLHNSIFFKKYVWDQGWVNFRNTGDMPIFFFSEVKCKSESGSQLLMCSTDIKIEFILLVYLEPTYAFTYFFFSLCLLLFPRNWKFLSSQSSSFQAEDIFAFLTYSCALFLLITSFQKINFITFFAHDKFSILKKRKILSSLLLSCTLMLWAVWNLLAKDVQSTNILCIYWLILTPWANKFPRWSTNL